VFSATATPVPASCVIPGRSPGASGYGGTSPTYAGSWSQWSWGVYGDAEADITDRLSMGVAGRYEHYNTFGGSFVYKVNGIYKVTPQFSVRATIGTGFHAPSPGQSHDAILGCCRRIVPRIKLSATCDRRQRCSSTPSDGSNAAEPFALERTAVDLPESETSWRTHSTRFSPT